MNFICNFPFFSILLSLFSGTVCSILPGKAAKVVNRAVIIVIGIMSTILLVYLLGTNQSFVYWMGHFPAPWGNEIRAGVLEAGMALFFVMIMFLCMKGGEKHIDEEIEENGETFEENSLIKAKAIKDGSRRKYKKSDVFAFVEYLQKSV